MARQWSAEAIAELMRGYQGTCVLLAAAELDLVALLARGGKTVSEAATALQTDYRGMQILLDALGALGLVDKQGETYAPAVGVAEVLTAEGGMSMLAMAWHQANVLRGWAQLGHVVKTGKAAVREPSIRGERADYAAFIEAMDNISRTVAPALVQGLPELKFNHLLDVGGASGTWTIAFLQRYPGARATLFDLPKVIPQAAERLRGCDLLGRVRLVGGDFTVDELPRGADLAWVSAIIHQMSRKEMRVFFHAIFAALENGGQILIRDYVMEPSRTEPAGGALFAVNMLVNTDQGGTFTLREIQQELEAAGFKNCEPLKLDGTMNSVVRAQKPS